MGVAVPQSGGNKLEHQELSPSTRRFLSHYALFASMFPMGVVMLPISVRWLSEVFFFFSSSEYFILILKSELFTH